MAALLWEALRARGLGEYAPVFVDCRVYSLEDMPARMDDLASAGVPRWALELVLQGPGKAGRAPETEEPRRRDMPQLPRHHRASSVQAFNAARPENRDAALLALEGGTLASTTRLSNDSRVRFYEQICAAWNVQPWPITVSSIRSFGASLKAGSYRSASVYFAAVSARQVRHLGTPVEDVIRQCIRDTRRSIFRGAGVAALKASFRVACLVVDEPLLPFDLDSADSTCDMMIIMSWWMLRELEAASAMCSHLCLNWTRVEVTLWLPVSKTDIRGSMVSRTLACACQILKQKLCPFHACHRYLQRVKHLLGAAGCQDGPLFPASSSLEVPAKAQIVSAMRRRLGACGVQLHFELDDGRRMEKFGGHCARVSGAQWLHAMGLPLHMIQALGQQFSPHPQVGP